MKCSFCGADIRPGSGKIVVLEDGSFLTFCSRKCERNKLVLKRSPQRVKWTASYHREKEIRLHGKERREKKVKTEETVKKKKKLSKKERRELRKQKKLEKKMKRKKMKTEKTGGGEK